MSCWLVAGFVSRVATGDVRIADDLRVVVGCHRDQLQTLLADCDCLVLDPLDVVNELINPPQESARQSPRAT